MSNEPIVVQIERTQRRKIILASLTGYIPLDLQDLEAEKMKVSDKEIKNFLCTMSQSEMQQAYRKFGEAFRANAKAALGRLAEEANRNRPPANGRTSGVFLDFDENHVPSAPSKIKKN